MNAELTTVLTNTTRGEYNPDSESLVSTDVAAQRAYEAGSMTAWILKDQLVGNHFTVIRTAEMNDARQALDTASEVLDSTIIEARAGVDVVELEAGRPSIALGNVVDKINNNLRDRYHIAVTVRCNAPINDIALRGAVIVKLNWLLLEELIAGYQDHGRFYRFHVIYLVEDSAS